MQLSVFLFAEHLNVKISGFNGKLYESFKNNIEIS